MRVNGGGYMRHKCVDLLFILTIFWLSNLAGSAVEATKVTSPLPRAHLIAGITQHKQLNGLDCGPASVEIVFDYWGPDIDQKAIADVARTSSIGTYTWDIVRTGQFSYLSSAYGRFFPSAVPIAGFTDRPIGYASFSYSSDSFWWTYLKGLIASNIPVILLMKYSPSDSKGHYRVLVGYDEDKGVVYFMDPWDRGMGTLTNPDGTVTWTMADFQNAWNYVAYGATHPYWGAVLMPWSISLHTTGKVIPGSVLKVTAVITYPCPMPFDRSTYPALDACAAISLQGDMSVEGSTKIKIGTIPAGGSIVVSWSIRLGQNWAGSSIAISVGGNVSGTVPDDYWNSNGAYYSGYKYTDWIGGEASINL
jgi:hypothetical protein